MREGPERGLCSSDGEEELWALTKSEEVLVSAGTLSLVCHTAVSPWRLVVQGHILYSDTAILNEAGKTRHFGLAMGPSTVASQASRTCRNMRSNYIVRTWLSGEIMVHLDKARSEQALASPGLSLRDPQKDEKW